MTMLEEKAREAHGTDGAASQNQPAPRTSTPGRSYRQNTAEEDADQLNGNFGSPNNTAVLQETSYVANTAKGKAGQLNGDVHDTKEGSLTWKRK